MASDTTTTLNAPGVPGGDVMDESLVTQTDGVTQAKRPRVVPGGDDGTLQSFGKYGSTTRAFIRDPEVVDLLTDIREEMRMQTAALKMIAFNLSSGEDDPSFEELSELREA